MCAFVSCDLLCVFERERVGDDERKSGSWRERVGVGEKELEMAKERVGDGDGERKSGR